MSKFTSKTKLFKLSVVLNNNTKDCKTDSLIIFRTKLLLLKIAQLRKLHAVFKNRNIFLQKQGNMLKLLISQSGGTKHISRCNARSGPYFECRTAACFHIIYTMYGPVDDLRLEILGSCYISIHQFALYLISDVTYVAVPLNIMCSVTYWKWTNISFSSKLNCICCCTFSPVVIMMHYSSFGVFLSNWY